MSPGLTSASSSKVMRVTSLFAGFRARRPLAFFEESHLRLTNVTRQLLQGCPPPVDNMTSHRVRKIATDPPIMFCVPFYVMYLNWMTKTHLVQVCVLCPPSCRSALGAGDTWRFWSWKTPSASLEGPKSLHTNTAQWVGAHCNITTKTGCLWSCHRQTGLSHKSVWSEESGGQRTYAALTAAGVEPGRGLPSEDGDPTTDWVAAVRLCKRSHIEIKFKGFGFKKKKKTPVVVFRPWVTYLPDSEP